jgi:hypothetical protein
MLSPPDPAGWQSRPGQPVALLFRGVPRYMGRGLRSAFVIDVLVDIE